MASATVRGGRSSNVAFSLRHLSHRRRSHMRVDNSVSSSQDSLTRDAPPSVSSARVHDLQAPGIKHCFVVQVAVECVPRYYSVIGTVQLAGKKSPNDVWCWG